MNETLAQLLLVMEKLDERIGPMLEQDGRQFNTRCVNWPVCHRCTQYCCCAVSHPNAFDKSTAQ